MEFACYSVLLVLAALCDVWRFVVPNGIPAALAVLFLAVAMTSPIEIGWLSHAGAAAAMLLGGALLYRLGQFGGGDVKLMAAVALWAGFDRLLDLLVTVALGGGMLAFALVLLRWLVAMGKVARAQPGSAALPRVLTAGEGVPYAVAIAAGGLIVGMALPHLGAAP